MSTIELTLTAAEVTYTPAKGIRRIAGAIAHGAWLLLDPAGWLRANTTKAERAAMGVKLPGDNE